MAAIHRRGWCDGTGGNFSVRVPSCDPPLLLMAPSGVEKGTVQADALILVNGSGEVVQGSGRASAEWPLHWMAVSTQGAGAVLHTHSQAGTLLSDHYLERGGLRLTGLEMLKGLNGRSSHQEQLRIPVIANDQNVPRLAELAQRTIEPGCPGLLVAGHGLYAWGAGLSTARRHLEILEFLLEQHWRRLLLQALAVRPG
ncbi:methylthioribulose 1-phosphate dehydratase [Synechococcus sp. RSCCF101]|uniref:methylthioribulose 1-phosphate dehydratase n=1 Tax=Synechococcus sp. RSCCF101 TaxID=2511069 RepID=UPI00351A875F